MKRIVLTFFAVAVAAFTASAQQASSPEANPVSNALRRLVESNSKNMIASAEEMPADKYSFRPTPAQMSFGILVVHATRMNYRFCSIIAGTEAPKTAEVKDTDPKDTLVAALKSSFDFCTQSFAKLDDSKLGEQVPFFGGRMASRGAMIVTLAEDYGDHYSTAAMHLRLNGLLPPTAQPRK